MILITTITSTPSITSTRSTLQLQVSNCLQTSSAAVWPRARSVSPPFPSGFNWPPRSFSIKFRRSSTEATDECMMVARAARVMMAKAEAEDHDQRFRGELLPYQHPLKSTYPHPLLMIPPSYHISISPRHIHRPTPDTTLSPPSPLRAPYPNTRTRLVTRSCQRSQKQLIYNPHIDIPVTPCGTL